MALPKDLYPLATNDGAQIEAEFIRPESITSVAFTGTTGTALDATLVAPDEAVIFYADQDCIVTFDVVATANPSNALGFLLLSGERGSIIIPQGITQLSVIGLSTSGTLFIQKLTKWAGVGNEGSDTV